MEAGNYFSAILENDPGGVYMNLDCAKSFFQSDKYRGLSGIHISIIKEQNDILTLLLKQELYLKTKTPVQGKNKATNEYFKLPAGQDCLFLALCLGHFDEATHIWRYAAAAKETRFFRAENSDERSHLEVLAMLTPNENVRRFIYGVKDLLAIEIRPNPIHTNALFTAMKNESYELVYVIEENLKTLRQREAFYCAVTDEFNGQGLFSYCGKQEQNRRVAVELAWQAVNYLQLSVTGHKWLQRFWQLGDEYREIKGSQAFTQPGQWNI